MRSRRAFSLVELLVAVGLIAILVSVLLPALGGARRQAHRVTCAARLSQLGQALHLYAFDYAGKAMPLAYTDQEIIGDGPPIYWWGTNDAKGVDHTRGFVWPYLQSELRAAGLYECPNQPWGTYVAQGAAREVTSTYGYNGYHLCPRHTPGWSYNIGHRPWANLDLLALPQRLFTFADTLIDLGGDLPQNNALLDPPKLFVFGRWIENRYPTTAFRHEGRVNAALADGHVEAFHPGDGRITSKKFGIGSVGGENDPHYVPDWREW